MTDDLTSMPGHLVRRLNQRSNAVFQKHTKEVGEDVTSVQFAALSILEDHPGLDQANLAKRVGYDRATIGEVVKRMEQKEFIRREPDKQDKRAYRLWLSLSGRAVLAKLRPVVRKLQEEILSGLTDDEKRTLIKLMKKSVLSGTSASDV